MADEPAAAPEPDAPDEYAPQDLPVHLAVAKVIRDMAPVGKWQRNEQQGYAFRGIDDVLAAAKPAFGVAGIIILPRVAGREHETWTTKNGGTWHRWILEVEYRIIGPRGDELATTMFGEGTDAGDKAIQKAMTAAFKYLLFELLMVADHSAADADLTTPPEQDLRRKAAFTCHECGKTGEASEFEDRDVLRSHLEEIHGYVRLDDGRVVHPDRVPDGGKAADGQNPPEPPADAGKAREEPTPIPAGETGNQPSPTGDEEDAQAEEEPGGLTIAEAVRARFAGLTVTEITERVNAMEKPELVDLLEGLGKGTAGGVNVLRSRLILELRAPEQAS